MNRSRALDSVQSAPQSLFSLEPDALLLAAARKYGSDDFGVSGIVVALHHLVASLEASASLTQVGRLLTRFELLRLLGNAIALRRCQLECTGSCEETVREPLIVTGMPCSGGAYLQRLLAQDPAHRALEPWEIRHPAHGVSAHLWRPILSQVENTMSRLLAPQRATLCQLRPGIAQECSELLGAGLLSHRFDSAYDVPGYRAWLDADNTLASYHLHQYTLKLLQWQDRAWGDPRRWVLYGPDHSFGLPALLAAYPGAKLILTHRNPVKVVPSVAQWTLRFHRLFSRSANPRKVGAKVLERWAQAAMQVSLAAPHSQSLTLSHKDISRRPIDVVKALYRRFDWELTPQALRRMETFVRQHPQREGNVACDHQEQFGFSDEALYDRFFLYNLRMSWYLHSVGSG